MENYWRDMVCLATDVQFVSAAVLNVEEKLQNSYKENAFLWHAQKYTQCAAS